MKNKYKIFKVVVNSFLYSFILFSIIVYVFNLSFNISDSAPLGIYRLENKKVLKKGDYIVFKEPKEYEEYAREDLKGYPSLKKIAAIKDDIVEIKNSKIYINNIERGVIEYDIPQKITGKYKLKEDEYFLLNNKNTSLDSRYYGIVKYSDIDYKAKLVVGKNEKDE